MGKQPVIEAEITFLPAQQGGRSGHFVPCALNNMSYRPHIVLGDPSQREPLIEEVDGQKRINEEYLGVAFCDGPEVVPIGEPVLVKMVLMHYPELANSEVKPGATFTIREGAKIVGFGQVKTKS